MCIWYPLTTVSVFTQPPRMVLSPDFLWEYCIKCIPAVSFLEGLHSQLGLFAGIFKIVCLVFISQPAFGFNSNTLHRTISIHIILNRLNSIDRADEQTDKGKTAIIDLKRTKNDAETLSWFRPRTDDGEMDGQEKNQCNPFNFPKAGYNHHVWIIKFTVIDDLAVS